MYWNDKNPLRTSDGKFYLPGEEIPDGVLSKERIKEFKKKGLLKEKDKPKVKSKPIPVPKKEVKDDESSKR
jgi:hypothetical protein